jgi:serine/threonine protein kinase
MENAHAQTYDSLDREQHVILDRLAGRFEAELKNGEHPHIEDFLAAEPDAARIREVLLQELLALEWEYSSRDGKYPDPQAYETRFPDDKECVASALDDFSRQWQRRVTGTGTAKSSEDSSTPNQNQDAAPRTGATGSFGSDDPPLPKQVGRYEILRLIACGGFGRVLLANDPELDRWVAVKVAHDGLFNSDEQVERFLTEARLAARLSHPNIVSIHDVGRCGQLGCYIVMDYIDGAPLDVEEMSSRLNMREAVRLVAQVADAVHQAHTREMVHRDIKPGNLLIDGHGTPFVIDFGLAVHDSQQRDHAGEVSGTPPYMSPEQVRGLSHQLDGRTDIWSLGVLLYELVTGRQPFQGQTRNQLFDEILHRDPKPLRQIDDRIPPELERICLRALVKKPAERYSTARDFADDLRRVMEELEESSSPLPPPTPPPIINLLPADRQPWPWTWPLVGVSSFVALAVVALVAFQLIDRGHEHTAKTNKSVRGSAPRLTHPDGSAHASKQPEADAATPNGNREIPLVWSLKEQSVSGGGLLDSRCTHLAVSADGLRIAAATAAKQVLLFDLTAYQSKRELKFDQTIRDISISCDGTLLGVICDGSPPIHLLVVHSDEPFQPAFAPMNPTRIMTSSHHDSLQVLEMSGPIPILCDARTGGSKVQILGPALQGAQWAQRGAESAMVGYDHEASCQRVTFAEREESVELPVVGNIHSFDLVLDEKKRLVLGGYYQCGVQVWLDGKISKLPTEAADKLYYNDVAFLDDGRTVVSVGRSRQGETAVIRVWSLTNETDEVWQQVLREPLSAEVLQVAFGVQARLICLATPDSLRLLHLDTK